MIRKTSSWFGIYLLSSAYLSSTNKLLGKHEIHTKCNIIYPCHDKAKKFLLPNFYRKKYLDLKDTKYILSEPLQEIVVNLKKNYRFFMSE